MIKDYLEHEVEMRGRIGIPCLLERFVLRNGIELMGSPFEGKRRKPKQCFMNSTHVMEMTAGMDYYEGLCINAEQPILAFHHAWNVKDGKVYDSTLANPEKYAYMGVHIPAKDLHHILVKTGYYGCLSVHEMYNAEYMFKRDPELENIAKDVMNARSIFAL